MKYEEYEKYEEIEEVRKVRNRVFDAPKRQKPPNNSRFNPALFFGQMVLLQGEAIT